MESTERYRTLQQGEMLNWYRVERVLGRGGFGVIYLATDTNLDHQVAIKEYVPGDKLLRNTGSGSVSTEQEAGELHRWGLERFLREARNLVKFKHPNIVRVISVFEQNQTAYLVMEFEEGMDLRRYFALPEHTGELRLKSLILPIAEGLAAVHSRGFIHRDIKPSNILVRSDGTPVLLDFGSARETSREADGAFTALVSVGFAPLEQYSSDGDQQQGPWTDIYALGGVLYAAVCGCDPTDSTRRGAALFNGGRDPMLSAQMLGEGRYSREFLAAIDWALAFKIADRPQTLADWMPALLAEGDDSGWHPQAALDLAPPIDLARAQPLSDMARSWLDEAAGGASDSRGSDSQSVSRSVSVRRSGDSGSVTPGRSQNSSRYTRRPAPPRRRLFDETDVDTSGSRRPSTRRLSSVSRRVEARALDRSREVAHSADAESSADELSSSAQDSAWRRTDYRLLQLGRRARYRLRRHLGFRSVVVLTVAGIALSIWLADQAEDHRDRVEARDARGAPNAAPATDAAADVPLVADGEAVAGADRDDAAAPAPQADADARTDAEAEPTGEPTADTQADEASESPAPSAPMTAADRRAAERRAATERAEAKDRRAIERRQAEMAERRQVNQSLAAIRQAIDSGNADNARAELEAARSLGVDEARLATLREELDRAMAERRRPVNDDDFDLIVGRFNALARAIESQDAAAMNRLSVPGEQNALFEQLFERFDKLNIDIVGVRVRNADRTISATLRIKDMERSSGAIATPSDSYRDRVISSRRVVGEWSLIRW